MTSLLKSPHLDLAVRDNLEALAQGRDLLAALGEAAYVRREPACFNSSIGGHLRHVIEHYESFLQARRTGVVDYEARARDARIENEPAYAVIRLEQLREELSALADDFLESTVEVRSEMVGREDAAVLNPSSVGRELEFLLSHTIHHYALIAVVCALGGKPTPVDFGVAPSTLRFRRCGG
ncbi:MAG: DinB family protein [Verrucomicrobia bacterium]|nr:DinB family protein [Verrucomicrobiota bacterium]